MKIFDKKQIIILIFLIIIALVSIYFFTKESDFETIPNDDFYIQNTVEVSQISTIKVHITGEVLAPGIVELSENARISDAIQAVGGTTRKC